LIYVVAPVALLHFWWMRAGKNDFAEPAVYIAIIGVLLGWRVWRRWQDEMKGTRMKDSVPFIRSGSTRTT